MGIIFVHLNPSHSNPREKRFSAQPPHYMSNPTVGPLTGGNKILAGKYLTFTLGHESYGIPVLQVREIIRHTTITAVPQMPDYVKGVLNLRGKVIPIVDLRLKFELASAEIAAGGSLNFIKSQWKGELEQFKKRRAKFLIYK